MINYRMFQKLKLLENSKFNHSIIILTLPPHGVPKLSLNNLSPTHEIFNILNGR